MSNFDTISNGINIAGLGPLTESGARMPVGKYPVSVIGGKVNATKNNDENGKVDLRMRVLDGPDKGVEGVLSLNIFHTNKKTSEIAQKQLARMAMAVGMPQSYVITDLSILGKAPFYIEVVKQPVREGDEDKGYVDLREVWDANGNKPWEPGGSVPQPAPVQQQAPAQQPQQAASWGASQQAPAQQGWGGGQPAQQPQQPAPAAAGWGGPPAGAAPAPGKW